MYVARHRQEVGESHCLLFTDISEIYKIQKMYNVSPLTNVLKTSFGKVIYIYIYILKVIIYKYFKDLFEREHVCAQQGEGQMERENLKQTPH